MLSLAALVFSFVKEAQAADPNATLLDDDSITYKDVEHGTFELVTKELIPRHIIVDDPGETIVLSKRGSSVNVDQFTNSAARMEELRAAQQDVLANLTNGFRPTGSSPPFSDPDLILQPINFIQTDDTTQPQNALIPLEPAVFAVQDIFIRPPPPPTLLITGIAGQIGVAGDNIINVARANAGVEITGTTSGVEDRRIVTVTLADSSNHVVYSGTATVTSGTWSINLSPAEAKALADGIYTLTADTTNAAGDPAEASQAIRVDETPPAIAIHAIVGNDVVNVNAASTGFAIAGTTTDAENGQPVTVKIVDGSGHVVDTFTTTLTNNSWSVPVSSTEAKLLHDGSYTVTADVSDSAGNPAPEATQAITVDETPPKATWLPAAESGIEGATIALGTITATVNSLPGHSNGVQSLVVSGIPAGAVLTDGENNFTASSGSTSVDVKSWNLSNLKITPPNDTNFTLTVTATDQDANKATASELVTVAPLAPGLNPVAAQGNEDTAIALDLGVTARSLSGENGDALPNSLNTLVVSGIPMGATLSDGTGLPGHSFTATEGNTSHDVASWNLSSLTITPPAEFEGIFTLKVAATERDSEGNISATATATELVVVAPVAEQPTASAPATLTLSEDATGVAVAGVSVGPLAEDLDDTVSATLTVLHGTLHVASLSGVTVTGDDSATLTLSGSAAAVNSLLAGLTYTPEDEFRGYDTLHLSVTSSDGSNSYPAQATAATAITVTENEESLIVGGPGPTLDWNDPANWSDEFVPTLGTDVTIEAPSNYTVIINGTPSAHAASLTIPDGAASTDITISGTLQLDGDINVSQSGKLENDGTLEEAANATFIGPITNNGTIIVDPNVDMDVTGTIAGIGKFWIVSGATLEFALGSKIAPGTTDSQIISFEQGAGKLVIDDWGKFAGVITGTDIGTHLTSTDLIDLTRLLYVRGSMSISVSYDPGTNISTMTFSDGISANNETLHLSGNYTGTAWTFTSINGGAGTEVFDPPADSGTVTSRATGQMAAASVATTDANTGGTNTSLVPGNSQNFAGQIVGFTGDGTAGTLSGSQTFTRPPTKSEGGYGTFQMTAAGTLTDTDVDNASNSFTAVSSPTASAGGYGSFTMTAAGVWTYALHDSNSAVQKLNVGDTLTDSFTVTTIDGTPQVVTITIHGANDAALVSGVTTGSVIEAGGVANCKPGTPTVSGTLTDTDVDNAPNTFTAVCSPAESHGGYGTFTMTADGTWAYTLDNTNYAVQALNVCDTLTDTFTVTTIDGTPEVVTITIHGTNDAAIISGTTTGSVIEAGGAAHGVAKATGTLTDADVDNTPNTFTALSRPTESDGGYGTFTMTAAGVWTYKLDNTNQALNACDTLTDTFTVATIDGTKQVVTITIHGANDADPNDTFDQTPVRDSASAVTIGHAAVLPPNQTINNTDITAPSAAAEQPLVEQGSHSDSETSPVVALGDTLGPGNAFHFKDVGNPANIDHIPASVDHHGNAVGNQEPAISETPTIELSPPGWNSAIHSNIVPDHAGSAVVTHVPHDLVV
jgi:VCBS repeat-containing protein